MKRSKILVVDDFSGNVELCALPLATSGYNVFTARNEKEALEIATAQQPDVILLGKLDTLNLLKSESKLDSTLMFFMVDEENGDDFTQGLKAGIVDCFRKPVDSRVITNRIKNAIRLKASKETATLLKQRLNKEVALRTNLHRENHKLAKALTDANVKLH